MNIGLPISDMGELTLGFDVSLNYDDSTVNMSGAIKLSIRF